MEQLEVLMVQYERTMSEMAYLRAHYKNYVEDHGFLISSITRLQSELYELNLQAINLIENELTHIRLAAEKRNNTPVSRLSQRTDNPQHEAGRKKMALVTRAI